MGHHYPEFVGLMISGESKTANLNQNMHKKYGNLQKDSVMTTQCKNNTYTKNDTSSL